MNDQHARPTTRPILVTGGTGTIGRHVVLRLRDAGCEVRVATRHGGDDAPGVRHVVADLATGDGLAAALDGVDVVVHLAGTAKGDELKAGTLALAARDAGVGHLVCISVVGADRVPMTGRLDRAMFGYYGAKAASERVVAGSGVPWSILRVTQVHDLTFRTVAAMAKLPLIPVPAGFRFQPIDSDEVAAALVDLALGEPAGRVADLGGPEVFDMADLVRTYLAAIGRRRPIVRMPLPGRAAAAMRAGANLAPDRAVGRRTWASVLADAVASTPRLPASTNRTTIPEPTDTELS